MSGERDGDDLGWLDILGSVRSSRLEAALCGVAIALLSVALLHLMAINDKVPNE